MISWVAVRSTNVRKLVAGRFHGLVHLFLGLEENIVDHYELL